MLTITPQNRIYVYTEPADMRKGANGLSAIIRSELEADPRLVNHGALGRLPRLGAILIVKE